MATAPVIEEPGTAVVPVDNAAAAVVLFDSAKFDAFYAKLKADIEAVPVDLSTDKGRKAIASAAAKVRTEKASIDRDRKRLTQEWRDMTAQVNGAWKGIESQLDALAVEARKPLTEWEAAEEARLTFCRSVIASFKSGAVVTMDDTAETVRARGLAAWEVLIKPETFGVMWDEAQAAKDHTVAVLRAALVRLEKEEADRAELAKLRAENEAREAAEAARRASEERVAREAEEERIAEERQKAARKAEADRLENVRLAAAAKAQREAEQAAEAERKEVQRVLDEVERKRSFARQIISHIQEVGLGMIGGKPYPYGILLHELTDKIKIDDSLGDMQGEVRAIRDATLVNVQAAMERSQERAAREEREEEERKVEAERRLREADQAHRTAVKSAAKTALMTCGADEETARKIVVAIMAGEVPNIRLEF